MLRSRTPKKWASSSTSPGLDNFISTTQSYDRLYGPYDKRKTFKGRKLNLPTFCRQCWRTLVLVSVLIISLSVLSLVYVSLNRTNSGRSSGSPHGGVSSKAQVPESKSIWGVAMPEWEPENDQPQPVQIPRVDRTILEKLRELEDELDEDLNDIDAEFNRFTTQGRLHWSPLVTTLPESRSPASSKVKTPLTIPTQTTAETDVQFCGRSPCRLLLPLAIAEREPKAQTDLVQLLFLAKALNRTVVLPNVGRGRIETCLRWDFSTYFDIASTVNAGDTPVIMMDDFRTWVDMRAGKPHGQIISLVDSEKLKAPAGRFDHSTRVPLRTYSVDNDDLPEDVKKSTRCLQSRYPRLDSNTFAPRVMHLGSAGERRTSAYSENVGALLVDSLSYLDTRMNAEQDEAQEQTAMNFEERLSYMTEQPEVLLLHWNLHHDVFRTTTTPSPVRYSSKVWSLVDRLATHLGPYLAVYWHMDKVPSTVLPACADALVDTLETLLHDNTLAHDIQHVWVVTDNPYILTPSPDPTFVKPARLKAVEEGHLEAVEIVRSAFSSGGELVAWRLIDLESAMHEEFTGSPNEFAEGAIDEGIMLDDSGFADIVEKMVATNSALFVSNTKACGRMSAGARQIAENRAMSRTGQQRNIASMFG